MGHEKIFTTGAFAKLCKTTKETLFHYDRMGLLKPRYVSQNGYRHYGIEQFFDFDLITTLKETGSSLQEIREYLHVGKNVDFLALLEAKRRIAQQEKEKLARRELMLQDMVACTREALNFTYDVPMVQMQKKERLEVVTTAPLPLEAMTELIEHFVAYLDFYQKQARIPRYPFGFTIGLGDILCGRFSICGFFGRATGATPRSLLHCKPEGEYAVMAHNGTDATHLRALDRLMQFVDSTGAAVAGNVYAYDMMSYMFQEDSEQYAAKYCVPLVRKA